MRYEKLKSEGEAALAICAEKGLDLPRLYPHPDDILLNRANLEVHVLGPLSKDEAIPYERAALARDIYHAYSFLEEKTGKVSAMEFGGNTGSSWTVIAMLTEDALPPSYQRDEDTALGFYLGLQSLTKKKLQQKIDDMFRQIEALPKSVEEQIEARKRAVKVAALVGEGLEFGLADLEKMQQRLRPTGRGEK